MRKIPSSYVGDAGEHFVLGELLRRGILAAQSPRNAPDHDIIAVDGKKSLKIRVKTKTGAGDSFRWNTKSDGTMFGAAARNEVVVLVDLGADQPTFYALAALDLERKMKKWIDEWLAEPGRGGRKRGETGMRFLYPARASLERYEGENAWALIERMLGRTAEQTNEVTQT
jgi:hypothetical protein